MLPAKFTPIVEEITKMFHFACVGATMGILNIGIIYLLTSILGIYYIFSAIFSYQVLLVLSFSSNDRLTFRSVTNHTLANWWHRFGSYYLVSLAGMLFYITIMFILTEYFHIYYLISSVLATLIVFLWNYFINKTVTWREKKLHCPTKPDCSFRKN
jgi:putative flippase GtrA